MELVSLPSAPPLMHGVRLIEKIVFKRVVIKEVIVLVVIRRIFRN